MEDRLFLRRAQARADRVERGHGGFEIDVIEPGRPELSSWAAPLGLLPVAIDRCNGLVVDRADEFEYDHTGGHIEAGAALDEDLISPFAAR